MLIDRKFRISENSYVKLSCKKYNLRIRNIRNNLIHERHVARVLRKQVRTVTEDLVGGDREESMKWSHVPEGVDGEESIRVVRALSDDTPAMIYHQSIRPLFIDTRVFYIRPESARRSCVNKSQVIETRHEVIHGLYHTRRIRDATERCHLSDSGQ